MVFPQQNLPLDFRANHVWWWCKWMVHLLISYHHPIIHVKPYKTGKPLSKRYLIVVIIKYPYYILLHHINIPIQWHNDIISFIVHLFRLYLTLGTEFTNYFTERFTHDIRISRYPPILDTATFNLGNEKKTIQPSIEDVSEQKTWEIQQNLVPLERDGFIPWESSHMLIYVAG